MYGTLHSAKVLRALHKDTGCMEQSVMESNSICAKVAEIMTSVMIHWLGLENSIYAKVA